MAVTSSAFARSRTSSMGSAGQSTERGVLVLGGGRARRRRRRWLRLAKVGAGHLGRGGRFRHGDRRGRRCPSWRPRTALAAMRPPAAASTMQPCPPPPRPRSQRRQSDQVESWSRPAESPAHPPTIADTGLAREDVARCRTTITKVSNITAPAWCNVATAMSTPVRIVAIPRLSCTRAIAAARTASARRARQAMTSTPSTRSLASQRWTNCTVVRIFEKVDPPR